MIVLDTDHVSVLSAAGPRGQRLKDRLQASGKETALTIISVEEQMRGWLAEIRRQTSILRQITPYERLGSLIEFWQFCRILPFDELAAIEFQSLRSVRIGTQDLKIAAIVLVRDALLLTKNARDFERVPGLRFEDWLD